MAFKFMCKRVYGRTLFYPVDDNGKRLLKIFRRTTIDGIQNMAILKLIIPIEIVYEEVNFDDKALNAAKEEPSAQENFRDL